MPDIDKPGISLHEWSHYKRLYELCLTDRKFAEAFAEGAPVPEGLHISWPEEARDAIIFSINHPVDPDPKLDTNPYIIEFRRRYLVATKYLHEQEDGLTYNDTRLGKWNRAVENRVRLENYQLSRSENLRYIPITFEMSDGCKQNCPFCAVSAPRWKSDFLYTEENARLWKGVLKAAKEIIGTMALKGACYFGTEPLDNPDYEKFLIDFRDILGDIPQTTTVAADIYPDRIRSLMKLAGDRVASAAFRFSIRSLAQRDRMFRIFSPEEMADVELMTNNPESFSAYSTAGRERGKKLPEGKRGINYSISCIAGYRVNMARGDVELTEPEIPEDKYPDGICVLGRRSFRTAEEFAEALRDLSATYIHDEMPEDLPLFFNKYMSYERDGNMITLKADCRLAHMSGDRFMFAALEMLEKHPTFREICAAQGLGDFAATGLRQKFRNLYHRGYIRYEKPEG